MRNNIGIDYMKHISLKFIVVVLILLNTPTPTIAESDSVSNKTAPCENESLYDYYNPALRNVDFKGELWMRPGYSRYRKIFRISFLLSQTQYCKPVSIEIAKTFENDIHIIYKISTLQCDTQVTEKQIAKGLKYAFPSTISASQKMLAYELIDYMWKYHPEKENIRDGPWYDLEFFDVMNDHYLKNRVYQSSNDNNLNTIIRIVKNITREHSNSLVGKLSPIVNWASDSF